VDLNSILEEFYDDLADQDRRPNTIISYRSQLGMFSRQANLLTATIHDIKSFVRAPASANHRRLRYMRLRVFYRWLEEQGYRDDNPTQDYKMPSVRRGLPKALDIEVVRLIEPVARRDPRHYALFCLLTYQGMRVSEAIGLEWDRVRPDRLTLDESKTGARALPLHTKTKDALEALDRTGPLVFPSTRRRGHLCHHTVSDWVSMWARIAGVEEHVWPHRFRHTFATTLLRRGVDIVYVSRLMGHANLETTQIYTEIVLDDLHREHKKLRF
jgi:integrase/recombinase XerD